MEEAKTTLGGRDKKKTTLGGRDQWIRARRWPGRAEVEGARSASAANREGTGSGKKGFTRKGWLGFTPALIPS